MSGVEGRYNNGTYLRGNPDWHAGRAPWKAAQVKAGLDLAGLHPQSICDIGCGTGLALSELARMIDPAPRAVGFEPSQDAPLAETATNITLTRTDPVAAGDHFDVVMMLDVFEHVSDYLGFLGRYRGLGDHFVFHIPLGINVLSMFTRSMETSRQKVGHLHYFTGQSALESLQDAGYEIVATRYTKAAWEGPGRNPWTPQNLLRRLSFGLSQEWTSRILGGVSLLVVARPAADTVKRS